MNYRHAYHAGNFADVLKHAALLYVLSHLRKKDAGFCVVDTHAGRGVYDLTSPEARVTREAKDGVLRLLDNENLPPLLKDYVVAVHNFGGDSYPGSPLLAAKTLRAQDRLIAIEKHPDEAAALKTALADFPNTRIIAGDGYTQSPALLPPREKRGVVLIDPPYEGEDEFRQSARTIIAAHRRFATGIYIWWYPLKSRITVDATIGELRNASIKSMLRAEIDVGSTPSDKLHGSERLSATGILVINPPYGFREAMAEALPVMAETLQRGDKAKSDLTDFGETG